MGDLKVNEIKTDSIKHQNGTSALTIDQSGRVTKPQTPAWRVSLSSNESRTATTEAVIQFDQTSNNYFLQGGCTLASGIITVPVAGIYHASANIRVDSIGSGYVVVRIRKNGINTAAAYTIYGTGSTLYDSFTPSDMFSLSANDTLEVVALTSLDSSWTINQNSSFSGYLIG